MIGEEVFKEKMKSFLFSLKPLPILNPMIGIQACSAGILSNQAGYASASLRTLREMKKASLRSALKPPLRVVLIEFLLI